LYVLFGAALQLVGQENASDKLKGIIEAVDRFTLYDRNTYPLGRYKEKLKKKEADFAQSQLKELKALNLAQLSETEQISGELMRFRLQNIVDEFAYKMHLNPIQADQGFHLNLNYRIKPNTSCY